MPIDVKTQANIRIIRLRGKKLTEKEKRKIRPLVKAYYMELELHPEKRKAQKRIKNKVDASMYGFKEYNSHLFIAQRLDTKSFIGLTQADLKRRGKLYMDPIFTIVKKGYEGKGIGSRLVRNRLLLALKRGAIPMEATGYTEKGEALVTKHEKIRAKWEDIKRVSKKRKRRK